MPLKILHYNTFTQKADGGSPSPVCFDEELPTPDEMQTIAHNLHQPVTAFVQPSTIDTEYLIRYFTPESEIPACGHATLAAAYFLQSEYHENNVTFITIDGLKIRTLCINGSVQLNYPAYQLKSYPKTEQFFIPLGIRTAIASGYCEELETLFIEVSADKLLSIEPDFAALKSINDSVKEIVVTSVSENINYDFLLRSFCPWIGIDEDPVTGSVHAALGPYWKNKLRRNHLKAYQASSRGGDVELIVEPSGVVLIGKTIRVSDNPVNK